jgi:hypothetical protein
MNLSRGEFSWLRRGEIILTIGDEAPVAVGFGTEDFFAEGGFGSFEGGEGDVVSFHGEFGPVLVGEGFL